VGTRGKATGTRGKDAAPYQPPRPAAPHPSATQQPLHDWLDVPPCAPHGRTLVRMEAARIATLRSRRPWSSVASGGAIFSVALAFGCGSTGTSAAPGDAGTVHGGGASDSGSPPGDEDSSVDTTSDAGNPPQAEGGVVGGDAAPLSACVPAIPQVAWTSPYAGWSRGVPTDPTFFPIGVWLQGSWHATELAGLGINVYIGNNAGTDSLAASDLATLKAQGIYAILGQDSVGLASIDDTTIIGWWAQPDEPDNAQPASGGGYGPAVNPSTLVTQYNAYKAKDSTRPVWLGLGQGVAYDNWEGRGSNAPAESGYPAGSDIVSFDIYPYNNCGGDTNEQATCGQFWLNALGVDRLHQWSTRHQAVWTDIETTIITADTTTGPTPVQTASEVWLSLIHDANGIVYFIDTWNPSFREDGIFATMPMVTAVTALNKQIKSLAPELNSPTLPDVVTVTSSNTMAPIDTMVKASGTSLYLFSAISRAGTTMGSFTVPGLTGKAVATVVGENRTIDVTGGAFSDSFAANAVHIYKIDLAAVTCN
jgi:hypothetical protein